MKIKTLIVGIGLLLTVSTRVYGQATPPPPPPWWTNYIATNIFTPPDYGAIYSNNLQSVSIWLHDTVTNVDGTPATSMENYADLSTTTFSTSGAFSWEPSVYDNALTYATFNGLPTEIDGPNGNAYLVGLEGNIPEYIMPYDIAADVTINTTNIWPGGSTGFNLTGTNGVIGQWDEGLPLLTHAELTNRVFIMDGSTNLEDHSTAVAGMLVGAGVVPVFSNGIALGDVMKGMAYQGQVDAWSFNNDVATMTTAVGTNHIRLSNHSYGAVQGWYLAAAATWYWFGNSQISTVEDPKFGNYTSNALNYDVITYSSPTYLQVWAAANSLSNGPPVQPTNHYEFNLSSQLVVTSQTHPLDGDAGGYNSLSQEACAKDILTVGAVWPIGGGYSNSSSMLYAPFTSCGPTGDGRIKPDVVADGVNNILPLSSSTLAIGEGSGTSFATPGICGSISLLKQLYSQLHTNASDLLASTLKALVIDTADSGTTNGGPSYRYGYGLMNTTRAASLINADATNGLKNQIKEVMSNNGQYASFPIVSRGGTNNPVKITICWTDPPGTANSITNLNNPAIKLVNDLDLRIVSPSGVPNFPWLLNPDLTNKTVSIRSAAATTGDDYRNNVEQVYIANPVTNGTYTVNVTHKGTLTGSQWFSIAISGNVGQPPPPLRFNEVIQTGTNTIALGWPAVVGGQYQVQVVTNLSSTNWLNTGGIVSARLTNVVSQVAMPTNSANAFYRLIQLP